MAEYKFRFDPDEEPSEHEARWDKGIQELLDQGLLLEGLGPDGDWPIRLEDEAGNPLQVGVFLDGPKAYVEVYNTFPKPVVDDH